jgi:hypothetical protein
VKHPSSNSVFVSSLLFVAVVGLTVGISNLIHKPYSCANYKFKVSKLPFNSKKAECDKWSGMTMRIDKTVLGRTRVSCICPEGNYNDM